MRQLFKDYITENRIILVLAGIFVILSTSLVSIIENEPSQDRKKISNNRKTVSKSISGSTLPKQEYLYLTHRFLDHSSRRHTLTYRLLKGQVRETQSKYGYSKKELHQILQSLVQDYNKKYKGDFKVRLSPDLGYSYRYSNGRKDLLESFKKKYLSLKKKYCADHLLRVQNKNIQPDYQRIQDWQAPFIREVYEQLKNKAQDNTMNDREFIILMSKFVQHLKYEKIPKTSGKENLGLWPPVTCLEKKAGDCDSKSILFATLYSYYQQYACVLFLTKNHAFIGIKNRHKVFPTDKVVQTGGVDYLLLESTAPHRLGYVAPKYRDQLRRGTCRIVPLL